MKDNDKNNKCSCGAELGAPEGVVSSCPECNSFFSDLTADELQSKKTHFFKKPSSIVADKSMDDLDLSKATFEDLKPGTLLDHFQVTGLIGKGGMGAVYRARDLSLDRWVALKVISNKDVLQDKNSVEAFIHEARAQAQVNHAGIATMHYIGVYNNMPYFAMECVDGSDLEISLSKDPLPVPKVIDIGIQVTKALAEAREKGVIHRDLKPGNIIVTETGKAKLTDFGLAKTQKQGSLKLTGSENMVGTPDYMPPEQAAGLETDFRTDIYSLGGTLYHLAYGKPPFTGNNFMEVVSKHMSEKPDFDNVNVTKISPGFPEVLEKMMAKKPEDRYQSYEELEEALVNVRPESRRAASFPKRFLAFILDWIQFFIISGLMGFLVIAGFIIIQALRDSKDSGIDSLFLNPLFHLTITLVPLLILGSVQLLLGRSLGKFFMHLKVMSLKGTRPSKRILAARFVFQFLPVSVFVIRGLLPLPVGVHLGAGLTIWMIYIVDSLFSFFNPNSRSLHDLLLGTWVVKEMEHK